MRFIDRDEIARRLTYDLCIPIVREAMIAFSNGRNEADFAHHHPARRRPPVRRHAGRAWASAACSAPSSSACSREFRKGVQSHQGSSCCSIPRAARRSVSLEAGEITAIRTAAASAVATDALARKDAARSRSTARRTSAHARARDRQGAHAERDHRLGPLVRQARKRSRKRCKRRSAFRSSGAERASRRCDADIICTVTSRQRADPRGEWLQPGRAREHRRLKLCRACGSRQRTGRNAPLHRRQPRRRPRAGRGIPARESGGR